MTNFRTFWEGRELSVSLEKAKANYVFSHSGDTYRQIYTYIPPKTKQDRVHHLTTYEARLKYFGYDKFEGVSGYLLEYILRSGRSWRGRVRRLEISIRLQTPLCSRIRIMHNGIEGRCVSPFEWRHRSENRELNRNLRLLIELNKRN